MATYYIGADVHSNNTELAIEQRGKIVSRYSVPTTIPAISTVLSSLQGKKILAMEEGPMAGWLFRNLKEKVDKFIVSEPRRNKLITCEGDKDDRIDSGKLAILLRGNFLKAVHHTSDSHRAHLKHWINLYHDRVRDATKEQVGMAKKQFSSYARKYPIINSWSDLPGIGIIRATTIFAYLDTPWRFKNRAKLHRYCGVGLVRATSGKDKKGRPRPARLKLPWAVNRRLKNAVMGAATTAIERSGRILI